jgi:hypothetical protein
MSLADLLTMFAARIICTYTPAQYADAARQARANRHRWGLGQW